MTDRRPFPGKSVPQRTCIACRQVKSKRELIRVVRTPSGSVEMDLTGRKAGRGGYLCRKIDCWETGLKKDRLAYSLKTGIIPEKRKELLEQIKGLFPETGL